MKKALLGVFVVGLLFGADDKKPDDVKDKLKGKWTIVSMEVGGMKAPEDAVKDASLTFDGDNVTHEQKGKKDPATFKIDTTKKPAQLDVMPTEGPEKGQKMMMIFEINGDTLKIAARPAPGAERPKGFDDKDIMIITAKREKK